MKALLVVLTPVFLMLASCMPAPTESAATESPATKERLDAQNARIARLETQLHEMKLLFSSQLKHIEQLSARSLSQNQTTPPASPQPPQQVVIMPSSPVVTHRWDNETLPPSSPAPQETAHTNPTTHSIQPGDTLSEIAEAYHIPLSQLLTANPGLDPVRLRVGQSITLPSPSTPAPITQPVANTTTKRYSYTVKSGDTLSQIAQRYGLSLKQLLTDNPGLDPARLRIGKKLIITRQVAAPATASTLPPVPSTPQPSSHKPTSPAPTNTPVQNTPPKSNQKLLVRIPRNKLLGEIAEDFRTDVPTLNHLNHCALSASSRIPANTTLYVPAE
ncbi:MAG: LysM peptidoglycan-binding domain-containing protein [Verrucomicrobiota bacterium]